MLLVDTLSYAPLKEKGRFFWCNFEVLFLHECHQWAADFVQAFYNALALRLAREMVAVSRFHSEFVVPIGKPLGNFLILDFKQPLDVESQGLRNCLLQFFKRLGREHNDTGNKCYCLTQYVQECGQESHWYLYKRLVPSVLIYFDVIVPLHKPHL